MPDPHWLFGSDFGRVLAAVLVVLAVLAGRRGARLTKRSLGSPGHAEQTRWLVQGARGWMIAAGLVSFAIAFTTGQRYWFWFGVVFLAEEMVETGLMLLALGRRRR